MPQPFKHIPTSISEQAIQATPDGSGDRIYLTPNGRKYPSITTVLSLVTEDVIAKWRKRVGDEEANRVSRNALGRGSTIHSMIEKYLQNENLEKVYDGTSLNNQLLFKQLRPFLDKIDNIRVQEQALYSDAFRIAGRCDCIADYDGKLSIIDFKGSNHVKTQEDIPQYFLQTSFYAYAFFERTGIQIKQSVILVANESGGAQCFVNKPWFWWKELKMWRKKYEERYGI